MNEAHDLGSGIQSRNRAFFDSILIYKTLQYESHNPWLVVANAGSV